LKKTVLVFCLVLAGVMCAFLFFRGTATVTDYAMDTVVSITASGKGTHKSVKTKINKAMAEIRRIDSLMSISSPHSDVKKINSSQKGEYTIVSPEVFSLIELCTEVSASSGGAFDITVNPLSEMWNFTSDSPTVPQKWEINRALSSVDYRNIRFNKKNSSVALTGDNMSITLGAVAKGYAADRAAQILISEGITDAIIDLGGNIYALGEKRIGIQTPFQKRGEYYSVCNAKNTSVVTCGGYERYFEADGKIYHHILNPKTGYPAESGLKSVTVIGENSALADALSTTIFVLGKDKAEEFLSCYPKFSAKLLTKDDEVIDIK